MSEENEDDFCDAIYNGNLQEVTAFLDSYEQGALSERFGGYSILSLAVHFNQVDVVKLVLDRGYSVNASETGDDSPLHIAAKFGSGSLVELLFQKGADIDSKNEYGETPFHIAVEQSNSEIVDVFLKYAADVNSDLLRAIREGNLQKTTTLIDSYEQSASPGLLRGYSLLMVAVREDRVDIVKLLLDRGCAVNARGFRGSSPLHLAAENGNLGVVELLLGKGADVNSGDLYGNTPLIVATRGGHLGIVQILLKSDADINAKTKMGTTALHKAVELDLQEMVVLLLKNGAQVNCKNGFDASPLHKTSDPIIIGILMEFGANVNSRSKDGRTALHGKSEYGRVWATAALLEHGADINIKCAQNMTPLDCALHLYELFYGYKGGGTIDMTEDDYLPGASCRLLLRQQAKMQAVGLHVEKSSLSVEAEEKLKEFRESYQEEALLLKSEFIKGTSVSYYDIVRKDVRFLARYMDNDIVVQAAELEEYRSKFPMYASMIKSRFRRGRARNKLIEVADQVLQQLSGLPDDCTEEIIDFLCDEDLVVLIDVIPRPKS